jgi:hypothetical protein
MEYSFGCPHVSWEVQMSIRVLRLPSPALVVSTVALGLVLGGSALAAGNAAGSAQSAVIKAVAGKGSLDVGNFLTNVASVTIHAPTAGFVTVNGSVDNAFVFGCPCETHVFINQDHNDAIRSPWNDSASLAVADESLNNTSSANWVFPVKAGTHTFALRGNVVSGGGTVLMSGEITALFVPNASP